ncbi:MAG: Lrp/AsnC family transcriptional regulator [Candidatus Bathyarchaeia archaeon]
MSYPDISRMDELDRKILSALRLDARKSFLELAKELGVADATIHVRVKKMMEERVIKGFETVIDDGNLGYAVTAVVEIKVKPGTADEASRKLSRVEGVLEAHEVHGHCDILLKVKSRSLPELRDKLVREIRAAEEVVSSEAYPVLKIVKEERNLPISPEYRTS